MRTVLTILITCISSLLFAQIVNDDCVNGKFMNYFAANNFGCIDGSLADTFFVESSINAIPNFPFPYQSNCSGLDTVTNFPSKDAWYEMLQSTDVRVLTSDTISVSLWETDDCNNLVPLGCFVIDSYIDFNTGLQSLVGGKKYLQISAHSISQTANYYICATYVGPSGILLPIGIGETLCFEHEVSIIDVSSNGADDGSASVSVQNGNSPYTYLWSNSMTSSSITGLQNGNYFVTIGDINGCSEIDSVQINVLSTGINTSQSKLKISLFPNPVQFNLNLRISNIQEPLLNYVIIDTRGTVVKSSNLAGIGSIIEIDLSELSNGIYSIQVIGLDYHYSNKFVIIK